LEKLHTDLFGWEKGKRLGKNLIRLPFIEIQAACDPAITQLGERIPILASER
jgi:hypothetical protein